MNDNMTSFYAKTIDEDTAPLNVLFVIYPNIVLLDLVGPLQVFTHAGKTRSTKPAYQTHVVSFAGGQTDTNTILQIDSEPLENWLIDEEERAIHTLVFVGGDGAIDAAIDPDFIAQARVLAHRATRVCSVCSGALVLAATGLLDGRRAVTHWEDCEKLAHDYPAVKVEVDPIYIKDGHIWTSAGITTGIDMALAIVEEDLGKKPAMVMARDMVTPMVRSGGQSQFSAALDRQAKDTNGRFTKLHEWLLANVNQTIHVEDMAEVCGMSPRNFSRRYTQVMGISPAKATERVRVDVARELLATTGGTMQVIATQSGFQDIERMRRAFVRIVHTSPTEYRKKFQVIGQ